MTNNEIWVFVQLNGQSIEPTSLQLITKAREIAGEYSVVALIAETDAMDVETTVKEYGPDKTIILKNDRFNNASDGEIADALDQVVTDLKPNSLLFPATVLGRSVAPRLQAKLKTGLTADCLDIYFDGDDLVQVKPTYGDDIMCEIICPDVRPQMATVRPNIFKAVKQSADTEIVNYPFTFHSEANIEVISETPVINSSANIGDAKTVIALGRGANKPQIIEKAEKLASKLGGMVGVSRPLTDNEEFSHDNQIGQSGNTIAPELLINFGISGAVQYAVGIENAKKVVSINTDADAPIFSKSDYGFIGDADEFLSALLEQVR
ncbi:electron transfer flavoprotein subunit alpha [Paucilactobacillus hokkaidonensis JCM 18461]|uniref:Electron transfer flavoprotein subunit alpha n=2 Tax=Paucilactobacillus hokkaidonensis TaxID=1193095 RepID=A0A0A1H1X2_9LACO|nr:electron transfer flavoprotein subunit alpha/FixB family protein [Paucilactobacillus hokkaidonensis]BAP86696.1 electron transfer flavoprotein subunit alpha [Paucilactobacillus hokkaidonensis JCM 18461]